ncbi:MAG: glutamine synthetase family protein [Ornithinimicrobium sp.]|uniref:glutamine synthetase family protein n=1 Tax=Ornithinimicrobium sp. TaxID=1977084 RepID=UPI0026DF8076|nr:glutamine synthetase family protein [Ornithinimicrobium sp.]MDO5741119.1 glutamine synthetase family protein [Ornithinimicrobium sp.]
MSMPDPQTRLLFTDLLGLSHGKTVPSTRAQHPTHYALTVMLQGLDREFIELKGYSTDVGFPDMEARLDEASLRPSWSGGEVAMTNLHFSDGRPLPLCVRSRLREMIERWRARDLEPLCGIEMEFYLLSGQCVADGPLSVPWHRVYGTGPGADPSGLIDEIAAACERAGIGMEGINSEFNPGQVETAVSYREALDAADAAFLFRELAREVALGKGLGATFMARPFNDSVGNGMHLNVSAAAPDGSNAFVDTDDAQGISQVCRWAIAGLLEHHAALTALFAPTVNSYKRLRPGMLAGYWATWGLDNRLTSVRVPGQRGQGTRIEHRTPDGSASPHLALLGMLAAALDGIERELPLADPVFGDAEAHPGTDVHTASSLGQALDLLEQDSVLTEALGPDLTTVFVKLKRDEVDRWEQSLTDWEVNTYGRVY